MAARLFESQAFFQDLAISINQNQLCEVLSRLPINELDALRLFYADGNGKARTYREVTELLWQKGWGGSQKIGMDWTKGGLKRIRDQILGKQ